MHDRNIEFGVLVEEMWKRVDQKQFVKERKAFSDQLIRVLLQSAKEFRLTKLEIVFLQLSTRIPIE